jgi:hypothetical protein
MINAHLVVSTVHRRENTLPHGRCDVRFFDVPTRGTPTHAVGRVGEGDARLDEAEHAQHEEDDHDQHD